LTYTNITLIDVDPQEAAEWLAENSYTAAVSPTVDNITVIYENILNENADADDPVEELLKLASEMSYELGCIAWLVIVEDDVLIYSFYRDGNLLDSYGATANKDPEGGDAELLADVFDLAKKDIKHVRSVLRRQMPSAPERHQKLLEVLNIEKLAFRACYDVLKAGILPQGIDSKDDIIFVEADAADDEDDSAT
jgi:hypothetical protein